MKKEKLTKDRYRELERKKIAEETIKKKTETEIDRLKSLGYIS